MTVLSICLSGTAQAKDPTVRNPRAHQTSEQHGITHVSWSCRVTAGSEGGRHMVRFSFLDSRGREITWDVKTGVKIEAGKTVTVTKVTMMKPEVWAQCRRFKAAVEKY